LTGTAVAGALVAADAVVPSAAHAESQTITSGPTETGLVVNAGGQGASFVQGTGAPVGTHAVSAVSHAGTDNNSALNVASDNPNASAMMVTGEETGRGTIKVGHVGRSDGSDANASGISIALTTGGTAAQGLFVDAPQGTSGFLVQLRNSGARMFMVLPDGRIQFAGPATTAAAAPLPGTPSGYFRMLTPSGQAVRVPYYAE